jgi:hypothetical protein
VIVDTGSLGGLLVMRKVTVFTCITAMLLLVTACTVTDIPDETETHESADTTVSETTTDDSEKFFGRSMDDFEFTVRFYEFQWVKNEIEITVDEIKQNIWGRIVATIDKGESDNNEWEFHLDPTLILTDKVTGEEIEIDFVRTRHNERFLYIQGKVYLVSPQGDTDNDCFSNILKGHRYYVEFTSDIDSVREVLGDGDLWSGPEHDVLFIGGKMKTFTLRPWWMLPGASGIFPVETVWFYVHDITYDEVAAFMEGVAAELSEAFGVTVEVEITVNRYDGG